MENDLVRSDFTIKEENDHYINEETNLLTDDDFKLKLEPIICEELIIKDEKDDVLDGELHDLPQSLNTSGTSTIKSSEDNQKQFESDNDNRLFECAICGMTFTEKGALKDHVMNSHIQRQLKSDTAVKPIKLKEFLCKLCKKNFASSYSLRRHFRIHTGEKPFTCQMCDKKFTCKQNRLIHEKSHGDMVCECATCDKKFTQKAQLLRHIKIHNTEKQFACEVCDKRFTENFNLVTHQKLHTGERPFECGICGKKFKRKSHLKIHIPKHVGQKSVACKICDDKFKSQNSLQQHAKTHKNYKPFECKLCIKKFRTTSSLQRHTKTHTMT